ncbi:nitrite extrusion protein 2, partial [Klebsiella pneumoniae]
RLVVLVGLAIDQIAQSGLSSLSVIYYSAQLFSTPDECRLLSVTINTSL